MPDTRIITFISNYSHILQIEGFNISVPTLDVTTIYKSVRCFESGVQSSMFIFEKNEECYDSYDQAGRSSPPNKKNIYVSSQDVHEPSLTGNTVTFRANNKNYAVEFVDQNEAKYFVKTKVMHAYRVFIFS